MKVNEFIENYNNANNKDEYIFNSIIKKYVPYHEKMTDCEIIILSTIKYEDKFKINSPMRFMLFITTLISRYTDIGEDEDLLTVYESLEENNLIDKIISAIPQNEYTSYETILNMELSDYMENNRSISAIVEGLSLSLENIINNINNVPQDVSEVAKVEE